MKYRKIDSVKNEVSYKNYRNKLNHIMRISEKKCFSDLLSVNKNNVKKTWQIMKNIINKNKNKMIHTEFKLSDGSFTMDGTTVSNKFNEFFTNIGSNLAKLIPNQQLSPLHFMGDPIKNSIFLCPVTSSEISEILLSLKNGAPGYDEINAVLLKSISNNITEPLVYICNLSLSDGIFPNELKLANVLPLFKADDPFVFNNYRPVSLLCILSKVFEKIMYNRLIDFLDTYKLL